MSKLRLFLTQSLKLEYPNHTLKGVSANPTDNEHTGIEPVKLPTKCPEGGAPDFSIRHHQNRNTK